MRRSLFGVTPERFSQPNLALGQLQQFGAFARATSVLRPRVNAAVKRVDFLGPDCPPVISINGAPARPGRAINDFDPQEIEALEVYRRRDRAVPWEFQDDLVYVRSCGSLVVIWLKSRP